MDQSEEEADQEAGGQREMEFKPLFLNVDVAWEPAEPGEDAGPVVFPDPCTEKGEEDPRREKNFAEFFHAHVFKIGLPWVGASHDLPGLRPGELGGSGVNL